MRLDEIEWAAMWREAAGNSRGNRDSTEQETRDRWDGMAPRFRKWMDIDDYPAQLLAKIYLEPGWSALDIGCGSGAISIPVAKKAAKVTSLDISGEMLRILDEDARREGLSNITLMQSSWERVVLNKDLAPHDVVIASRSLGGAADFRSAVEKIDRIARRYVYVTVWGGGERGHHKGIHRLLGRPCPDVPDYIYAFNLLCQMGIRPNVEHLACHSHLLYDSLDEAVDRCRRDFGPMNASDDAKVREYLGKTLIKHADGSVEVPDNRPVWTLLWWKKN